MIEVVTLVDGEHSWVYLFQTSQTSEFVWRVYYDSRDPMYGFSLSLVLQAIRMIG